MHSSRRRRTVRYELRILMFARGPLKLHPDATGQKYQFARDWNIFTVKPEWVFDSIKTGYCLEESDYTVAPKKSCKTTSTPNKTGYECLFFSLFIAVCFSLLSSTKYIFINVLLFSQVTFPAFPTSVLSL